MIVKRLQSWLYPDPTVWDPVGIFLKELEHYIQPSSCVLDLGAGGGELNRYTFKGRVRRIVGVDLEPRVTNNPLLDEGIVADLSTLPFAAGSFDLAFSIYVLEHLRNPEAFVREVHRCLRPGGYFLALTPNFYHYVPLIAALTPTGFHQWLNGLRGRKHEDTFPTMYRMNTRRRLNQQFSAGGFDVVSARTIEVQPNYLNFFAPLFMLGAGYERLVNSTELFSAFRVNIIGVFRKKADSIPARKMVA